MRMTGGGRRILGIDPGSRRTGYGVVDSRGRQLRYLASGCIRTPDGTFPQRLAAIYHGVTELIASYRVTECAIEEVFLARNPSSALKLGQARGVAIAAAVAQQLPVAEYAARQVKRAVVGSGRAAKPQVAHMVQVLLALPGAPGEDAADALAIAICHVNTSALSDARTPQGT